MGFCRRWSLYESPSIPSLFEVSNFRAEEAIVKKNAPSAGNMILCLLVLIFCVGPVQPVYGQVDTGAILGTVRDQSGAVVPGAKVTLTNEGTTLSLSTTSGETGSYVFTPIKIGVYTAAAEAPGFQKATQLHVQVNIKQQALVDFVLVPGPINQEIEVTAALPPLQTQDASVGQVVGTREVNTLPLNGRNFTFLAQLTPGVTFSAQETRGLNASGFFVANGSRPDQNNYLLDGVDNNSNLMDFLNGTAYTFRPPVDAIQEFKVQTNNYSADLGRSAGAVLNGTIKSGTNELHGDVWEFLRNDKLDAADFFLNASGQRKPEFRLNQFGFALGGPVVVPKVYNGKDKTFFFFDYEGTRIRQGTPVIATVPTARERASGFTDFSELISGQSGARTDLLGRVNPLGTVFDPATTRPVTKGQLDAVTGLVPTGSGFVRDPFQGNLILAGRLDANAIKLLNLYPLPTGPGVLNNFITAPATRDDVNQFDSRVDHNFSERDQFFARFSYANEPKYIPAPFSGIADGGGFGQGTQTGVTTSGVLSETHSFSSTLINEARGGFTRIGTSRVQAFATTFGIPAQFGIPAIPQVPFNGGLPQILPTGLSQLGSASSMPSIEASQTTQFTDDLTKIHGTHTTKMGFQFMHLKFATLQASNPRGRWNFGGNFTEVPNTSGGNTGIAQMLLTPILTMVPNGFDNVGGANQVGFTKLFNADQGRNYEGLYIQDDWKLTNKLTVNLGLRWEHFDRTVENFGAQANFVPSFVPGGQAKYFIPLRRCNDPVSPSFVAGLSKDGITQVCSSLPGLGLSSMLNFAPRIGFAYHVAPKWVARAGYGIFYGGLENIGYGSSPGVNYPFGFNETFNSADAAHPLIYPNGLIGTMSNGLIGVPSDPTLLNAIGLNLNGFQYDFNTPYTQGYNLSFQYALTPNQTISLGYVGNTVRHLQSRTGNNNVTAIAPPSANAQLFVPFRDFARGARFDTTQGNSYYHSLQLNFERKFSAGLNLLANYTLSKCRTDASDPFAINTLSGYRAPDVPGFGIQPDYSLCDFDIHNVVHLSGGYELPFGHGKRFINNSSAVANAVFGGWTTNFILTLQDGQPLSLPCTITTATGLGCFALSVPGQSALAGLHNVNQWLNPAALKNPAAATAVGSTDFSVFGGDRAPAVGPGFHRMDLSFFKKVRTTEKTHLEFRAEIFNLTNHANFSNPGFQGNSFQAAPGVLDFTNTKNFGKITSTRDNPNDARDIQFALKFYW